MVRKLFFAAVIALGVAASAGHAQSAPTSTFDSYGVVGKGWG